MKSLLERLEAEERQRSEGERRDVPNLSELARATGVSREMMSQIANNQVKLLNLRTMHNIIGELRCRGFEVDVEDIVAYYDG